MTRPVRSVAARTGVFTESVIREQTRLAMEYGAINLAQGFPDFPAPPALKQAAVDAILADHNQYAITWGAKSLRDAVARKAAWFNGLNWVDPERHVTVTCGATEAMMATMLALVDPGDEVIVFEPFYENYGPDAALCGASLVYVALADPDFHLDVAALERAFTPRTRAIIINTPNNPSGHVFSRDELEAVAHLCRRYDVVAVTDEIYEHILYDGAEHVSIATLPGMTERTVTISGLSKTFSVTGWRLGYVIAPDHLSDAVRKVHDFLTVGAPAPLQEAGAAALAMPMSYYEELRDMYAHKRAMLYESLERAGFRCVLPSGAYYIMADVRSLTDEDDISFCGRLVREVGVAAVPGSSFYHTAELGRHWVRFTFSKREETLEEAVRRLQRLRG